MTFIPTVAQLHELREQSPSVATRALVSLTHTIMERVMDGNVSPYLRVVEGTNFSYSDSGYGDIRLDTRIWPEVRVQLEGAGYQVKEVHDSNVFQIRLF